MSSHCTSCTMPAIESFTQSPQRQESKGGAYACLTQTAQQCTYTAQGELVCGGQKSACGGDVKNGFPFMEGFSDDNLEGFKASMNTRRKK